MSAPLQMYEKLGAFYLGRSYDPEQREIHDDLLLYDSQDREIISDRFDSLREELESIQLKPRGKDIDIRAVALGWAPFVLYEDGSAEPLFI